MDRRRFLLTSLAGALAAPRVAAAQQADKVWRIGLLDFGSDPASSSRWKALRDRLRQLGYVEGQNVRFESRWSGGQKGLPALAAELVRAKVDIIVTAGSESAAVVRKATNSIPVVMATGSDLVALGLVASLSRPGGNVTGVISMTSELAGKRLELLTQLIPRVSRVTILRDPDNRGTRAHVGDAERVAKSLGVVLNIVNMHGHKDLDGAFLAAKRARADAAMFAENTPFIAHRQLVADLAITHRLPMVAPAREYAMAGVLVTYGTNYPDLFRRAAVYVDRILKGANPADLPIEQPTTFELVINLKTAKTLGLTVPPSLLARADQVIE